jgi:serralysin
MHFLASQGVPDANPYNSFIYQITGNPDGSFLIATGNDTLSGGVFADVMLGGAGNDTLNGSSGNDWLIGGRDQDVLRGGIGADILRGGAGRDRMAGGYGADDFDFNAIAETGRTASTRDVITDFQHNYDDIDLATIDANASAAGNNAFRFLATKGAAFTGVNGQLHWYQINAAGTANDKTIIEADLNGDRVADFQIELSGLKTLTAGDFVL